MTPTLHTDQITISLRPDGTVRGINVFPVATFHDEAGNPAGAAPLPPRDATLDDVTGLLAPSLVAQQGQIADLTTQLAAAQAATQAAQDDAAAKAGQIVDLERQLAAATAPAVAPAQNAAQQAAAAVFDALPAGKRALWEPVRVAVDARLAVGDVAGAAEIIATVPEIYDGMEADRAAFLALFAAPAQQ